MNFLALLFSLPTLVYGGCCIVPVVLHGVETFRASVGTPADACEGQWADLSCDQFEVESPNPEEPTDVSADSSVDPVTSSPLPTDSAIAFGLEEPIANRSAIAANYSADPATFDLPTDSAIPLDGPANSTGSNSSADSVTSSDLPTDSPLPPPPILVGANLSVAVSEAGPAEASPTLSFRFADLSGCGAFRTCPGCIANAGCMWSLSGCTKSTGPMEQWCSPVANEDTVKLPCELLTGCNKCTSTAGCIWYLGTCAYSRGIGCVSDPVNCINYAWNCPTEYVNPVIPRYQGGSFLPATSNVFGAPTLGSTGSLSIVGSQVLVPVSSPNSQLTIVPVTPSDTPQGTSSSQSIRYFSDPIVQPSSQPRPPTPQVYTPQQSQNSQASTLIVPAYSQPATSQASVQQQRSVPPSPSPQQAQARPSSPFLRYSQSSSNSEPSYSRPNTTPPAAVPNRDRQSSTAQLSSIPPMDNQFIISSFLDQAYPNSQYSQSQPQSNFQPTNFVDFSQSTPVQYLPPQSYLSGQFPYSGPNAQQFLQYSQPSSFPQTLQSSSYTPQLGQVVANQSSRDLSGSAQLNQGAIILISMAYIWLF